MKDRSKYYYATDTTDGLKVNTINSTRHLGRWTTKMTIFDRSNMAVEHDGKFKRVSIMGEVRYANNQKSIHMNGYKRIINRGTL